MDDATRTSRTGSSHAAEVEAYAASLHRVVVQLLRRRHRALGPFAQDDIAQEVVVRFLEDPVRVMSAYTQPVVYAMASLRSRATDFERRERSQRGEGARLVATAEGLRPRRIAISLDHGHRGTGDRGADWQIADPRSGSEHVLDRMEVEHILSILTVRERGVLLGVDGYDYSVAEIAEILGLRRETVSRLLNRVRRLTRATVLEAADVALHSSEALT